MKKQITVANLVMGVGALVVIIFSFLDFYKSSFTDEGFSAWSGDLLFPQTGIPILLALAMLVYVILDLLGVKLPDRVLTFNWKQMAATWGIGAAGIMLGWLFTGQDGTDKGAGLILMTIDSLAMAAGSIMALLGKGANVVNLPQTSPSSSSPSSPSAAPPPPPRGPGSPPPPPPPR